MRYISVNVAGLHISGGPGKIVLAPQGLDGWDDGVDVRRTIVDRPNGHGSYDAPGYLDSRVISITGRVLADSREECEALGGRITGLLAGGQSGRIQVTAEGGTQWAACRLSARTRFTPDFSRRNAVFQLQLWCADPRKFGQVHVEELTGGQSRSLYHYGNAEAAPLVEIRGPITGGYQINSNDGRVFRVNSGIASGSRHTIDMNDGLLRVNGRVAAGLVGQADVWKIPPGLLPSGGTLNMALKPDEASETPTGNVYITDTYI